MAPMITRGNRLSILIIVGKVEITAWQRFPSISVRKEIERVLSVTNLL